MKMTKNIIALLVLIAVFAAVVPATFATGSGTDSYVAGSKVTASFLYKNETGVEGSFSFSNPDLFVEDVTALNPTITGTGVYNEKTLTWMGWLPTAGDIGIAFNLTIKDSAAVGDSCTITHTYVVSINDGMDVSETRTESVTITVKAAETKPTEPKPTEPKPTEPKPTKPTTPAVKIDYTELNNQINIAEGLNESVYTDASWAALESALADAKAKRTSKDQAAVDAAALALKNAIAALVEMDYAALAAALEKAAGLNMNDELASLFKQLYDAIAEGERLMTVGDQAAVDACQAKILDLLAKIEAKLKELKQPQIVEVEKEVPVEVLPSGEYCNIHMHKVWPILFWISLALNVGFIAFIVIYFVRKKQNRTDNTPLVDYDITDDEV